MVAASAGAGPVGSGAVVAPPSTAPTGSALAAALTTVALGYLGHGGQNTGQEAKPRNYSNLIAFSEPGRGKLAQSGSVPRLWALFGPQALG